MDKTMVFLVGLVMKTIMASAFKARCLKVMDEVAESGEEVVVTKNGVPVGKFVPYGRQVKTLLGLHAGLVQAKDDLIAPTGESWNADQRSFSIPMCWFGSTQETSTSVRVRLK